MPTKLCGKESKPQIFSNKMNDYSSLFLVSLVVIYGVWVFTIRWFFPGKTKNLPPSPPKLPIIGNLHQMGPLPHCSFASLSKKYGPLISLHLGNKLAVLISSPAVVKEVIKSHDISFSGKPLLTPMNRLQYGGKGLLSAPYGDNWRKLRSVFVNHLLHKRMNKPLQYIRDEEISCLMQKIDGISSNSGLVNLTELFMTFSNNLLCKSAFGRKYSDGEEGNQMLRMVKETVWFLFSFTVGEFIPWLAWTNWLTGYEAKLNRLSKEKDEFLNKLVQEYVETSRNGDGFADILVGFYKGNTDGMSIDWDTLKSSIQDVLGAGTDTTATLLEWAMVELIRHPKVMKKLQHEVREILKGKQNSSDYEVDEMKYLKSVVKESLRLHAPVTMGLRETIAEVELLGYNIPSGTIVFINFWAICRDPTFWDEPEKFLPERFLNSSIDYNSFDFQFIPFGAGRRICPGINFATTSVERALVSLVHKFEWQLPNGVKGEDLDVNEKPGLVVGRKDDLVVRPTKCTLS